MNRRAASREGGHAVREAYSSWAATYDQVPNRTRDLDQSVTRALLGQQRFARVLELGCGTGKNTALLAGIGAQVLALDFSAGMLEIARARITASHVRFVETDLTQAWPAEAGVHDLVVCNLVLEHVENLGPVFVQAAQCLADGGLLLVCELHPFRQYQGTQARFCGPGGDEVKVPAWLHHLSDYCIAAQAAGLKLTRLDEWWHEQDQGLPPRLLSLQCHKPAASIMPKAGARLPAAASRS